MAAATSSGCAGRLAVPDTSAARAAVRIACDHHSDFMAGLSMADIKLQAAAGLLWEEELAYPEDDPVWIEHAVTGLDEALMASGRLLDAIARAKAKVDALRARPAPARGTGEEGGNG
jgi:hypothetical protein